MNVENLICVKQFVKLKSAEKAHYSFYPVLGMHPVIRKDEFGIDTTYFLPIILDERLEPFVADYHKENGHVEHYSVILRSYLGEYFAKHELQLEDYTDEFDLLPHDDPPNYVIAPFPVLVPDFDESGCCMDCGFVVCECDKMKKSKV